MKEKTKNRVLSLRKCSTIMLLDDEAMLLNAIQKYLRAKKFRVITCQSAEEGLEKIKKEEVDLLIVDILMPNIDGYEFIRYLREEPNIGHIPFIFLTAKGMTKDRITGYRIGCKAYLSKPFDPEELIAIIDNILLDKKNVKNIINIKREIHNLRNQIYHFDNFSANPKFTRREISILLAVSEGMRNKEIAHNLNISVRNVENYVTRLLNKTSLSNRVELANYKHISERASNGNRTRE